MYTPRFALGTLPYTTDVSTLSPGEHTFTATIIGADGVVASSMFQFNISGKVRHIYCMPHMHNNYAVSGYVVISKPS